MKNLLRGLLLVAGSTVVLTLGPVRAQDAAPPATPAAAEPAPPAKEVPPAADETPEETPDEGDGLSADNSLSFPVDI